MDQPALLLVHGYPFDHTLWDQVTAQLDKDTLVLAPDLRGFGGQPPPASAPSLDRWAEDLKRLLDEREIERVVLAGMSMGGYVALAFAEYFPARLAGLGLVSSQSSADTEETKAGRRTMIEKIRRQGPACAAQAAVTKLFASKNTGRSDLAQFPASAAERAGVDGIAWALEAMARRPDRTAVLKRLRVPVLILHGTEDQFIPIERARELARIPVDPYYVEVRDAGHATPLEEPAAVAQALIELVRRSYGSDQD